MKPWIPSVLLMAAKYGLPVWPHAGGVGLCEYVQHLSMIDYIAVSGSKDGRVIEFVDDLPKNDRGKVDKKALRKLIAEGTPA